MSDSYLGASVPSQWLRKYEDLAQKTGKSLEELVREALSQYLDLNTSVETPDQLNQEIEDLKKRVTELESSQGYINQLRVSIQVLEHKINQLSSSKTEIPHQSLPNKQPSLDDDTDEYDEPDEVLWDFMSE
jgi:uncharacterized coiled-coil DUF342 family protein